MAVVTSEASVSRAVEEFFNRGWGVMPVSGDGQITAQRLMNEFSWSIIDRLSRKKKDQWEFHFPDPTRPEETKKPDHGLCWRNRTDDRYKDPTGDDKYFFHWRAWDSQERKIPNLLRSRGIEVEKFSHFFHLCNRVSRFALRLALDFAGQFDGEYSTNLKGALLAPEAMEMHTLRLLCYDQKSIGQALANPHEDFSALTLCLYEDLPGLCLGHEKQPWIFQKGLVPVFGGRKIPAATDGLFHPLPHGVEAVQPGRRLAAVFFAHANLPMCPVLNK